MLTIQITENIQNAKTMSFNVSKPYYNTIRGLENYGGFKRFNLQVYEDNVKGQKYTNKNIVIEYLTKILFNSGIFKKH